MSTCVYFFMLLAAMSAIDALVTKATELKLEKPDIETLQTLDREVRAASEKKDLALLDAKQKALDTHVTLVQSKNAELTALITAYRGEIATLLEPFKDKLMQLQTEIQGAEDAKKPKKKGFFAELFNAENPAEFFHNRKTGFGKAVVGTLAAIGGMFGMATTAKALFSKEKNAATPEKGPMQKQFEDFANRIAAWFEVKPPFAEQPGTPEVPTLPLNPDRKALLEKLRYSKIDFKDPEVAKRAPLLSDSTVQLLVRAAEKFPGIRITSTIRTEEENSTLANSVDDSCHCYGEGFDIGRDTRTPPQYTLEEVKTYLDSVNIPKTALIHGEGDARHLHIDSDEGKKSEKRTKASIDKAVAPVA